MSLGFYRSIGRHEGLPDDPPPNTLRNPEIFAGAHKQTVVQRANSSSSNNFATTSFMQISSLFLYNNLTESFTV